MSATLINTLGRGFIACAAASLLSNTFAAAPTSPQKVITAKAFLEIGSGTAIADLTGNAKFPNNPDLTFYLPYFEWNPSGDMITPAVNYSDSYGVQMAGYFYPPASGDYVFWIASDDNGQLFLSADETAANKKLIAQETGYSTARNWETASSGTSESKNSQTFSGTQWPTKDTVNGGAKITLQRGKAYYIEALMKEGTGDDYLAVAVAAPDGSIDQTYPIPGDYLSSVDKNSGPPVVVTQPKNESVNEGAPVTFSVSADGTPPYSYQWQRNGADIQDATNVTYTLVKAPRADNTAQFTVKISNANGNTVSQPAVLTVTPDTVPPAVVLASTSLGTTVKIEFSEWVNPSSATNKNNYAIANTTITDATISDDHKTVTLAITGSLPANFEVTLGGIQDFGGNAIPANTKVTGYTTGLAPNMVSYWPLDKVEGTKTPDIISGYDLTLDNMSQANLVAGRWGQCFEFSNDRKALLKRVHSPTDLLPIYKHPAFTVSVWVNGPVQTDHRVYCETSSKATQPMFSIGTHQTTADGSVDSYIRNDANATTGDHHHSIGIAFDETWHHICWVQDSNAATRVTLYIDGVKDDQTFAPIWPLTIDTTCIGAIQRASAAAWFTGKIDDVAVWNRVLDPDEVMFLFTKGTPTPPPKALPLAINSFQSELPAVAKGDSVTLHWDVSKDATSVSIQPDVGDVTAKTAVGVGSVTVPMTTSKTFRMTIQRGSESVSSEIQVAVIDGVAANWNLLDNFDRYAVGPLPKPWGVSGANVTVVNVSSNRMLSVAGAGDSACRLLLNDLTIKEGEQRTLFARFYLPQTVTAAGIVEYMGLSDKGIRGYGDSDGDLGPDVAFQNPDGPLQIGTWNGFGSSVEFASFALQPQTVYNLWINIRNDPITDGDLVTTYIAKDGDAQRTVLFQDYRSDRNPTPDPGDLVGYPTKPDLNTLHVAANATTSTVYFDDFYLSKSGYLDTVPKPFGFTTPSGGTVDRPTLTAARVDSGNFKVDLQTTAGASYVLEGAPTIVSPAWTTVQSAVGSGQVMTFTVPITGKVQFFRARVQ